MKLYWKNVFTSLLEKKILLHNNYVADCETENANRAVVGLIHDAEDWRHKNDSFFLFYDV